MAIGDYVAAAVLIMLVLRGVAGILAQDKVMTTACCVASNRLRGEGRAA
jgi:hypothetical protein